MDKIPLPIRQQAFDFIEARIWKQLPDAAQQDCQQRLTCLLEEILKLERDDNERQDH